MGEQFWNFNCRYCGRHLKLTVQENNLGNKVEVLCQGCGQQTSTIIGTIEKRENVDLPLEVKQKIEKLTKEIQENSDILNLVESIWQDGFSLMLAVGVYENRFNNETIFIPKVDSDGKITDGTFTETDEEAFRKAFRIKL